MQPACRTPTLLLWNKSLHPLTIALLAQTPTDSTPLLKPLLKDVLGPSVRLIDSAEETAAETARTLGVEGLSAREGADPTYRFVASDDPLQFLQLGQRFLSGTMEGVEIRTLG